MTFMDQLGGVLSQYAEGQVPKNREDARAHYDQIASAVPQDVLGSVIGPALASLGQGQVRERIFNSATEMNPSQRGQFVQMLLSGLASSGVSLPALLGQLGINPRIETAPDQATANDAATLAAHAHQNRPDVFNQAMQFYAQHPTLVKVLGTLAIAKIAQNLSATH